MDSSSSQPQLSTRADLQWKRKFFHLFNGTLGFYLYVYSGFQKSHVLLFLLGCVLVSLLCDLARIFSARFRGVFTGQFSELMRDYELTGLTSATKGLGMALVVLLTCPEKVGILVMLFITYGDTAGGIVGPIWGRHRINAHATWEGCAAVFAVCAASTAYAFVFLFSDAALIPTTFVLLVSAAGLIGALSESVLPQYDDNVTVPLLSAPALWLLLAAFGIPL